jgi:hypothetical protein
MSDQPPYGQPPGQNPYQPSGNPYQPYGATGPSGPPMWAPDHPEASTVLILGVLGMAVCQVCAPFAWVKGARVKREIDASGGRYGGRSQVQVGYVLGIVGSCLLILYVLGLLFYIGVIVFAVASEAA